MEQRTRKKRKLGSYPFLSVTFSITLALFVIGLFGMMALHANRLSQIIQENVEIQVFLNKQISSSEITRIIKTVSSKKYVLKSSEAKPTVRLKTKEEAAKEFINQTGEDFTEFLGDNPLRDVIIVNIDPKYQAVDSLSFIRRDIEKQRGVYEVAYVETLVQSINDNLTKIGMILFGFFMLLLLVIVVLINNTIKLALFSQRFLIRSMQLVGATSRFIRRPFMSRSLIYGFIAGIMSSAMLFAILYYANSRIEELESLQDSQSLTALFSSLVALGMLVGYLSTYQAIKKYLKMSLDELY